MYWNIEQISKDIRTIWAYECMYRLSNAVSLSWHSDAETKIKALRKVSRMTHDIATWGWSKTSQLVALLQSSAYMVLPIHFLAPYWQWLSKSLTLHASRMPSLHCSQDTWPTICSPLFMLTAKQSESFPDPSLCCSRATQIVAAATKQGRHFFKLKWVMDQVSFQPYAGH